MVLVFNDLGHQFTLHDQLAAHKDLSETYGNAPANGFQQVDLQDQCITRDHLSLEFYIVNFQEIGGIIFRIRDCTQHQDTALPGPRLRSAEHLA